MTRHGQPLFTRSGGCNSSTTGVASCKARFFPKVPRRWLAPPASANRSRPAGVITDTAGRGASRTFLEKRLERLRTQSHTGLDETPILVSIHDPGRHSTGRLKLAFLMRADGGRPTVVPVNAMSTKSLNKDASRLSGGVPNHAVIGSLPRGIGAPGRTRRCTSKASKSGQRLGR